MATTLSKAGPAGATIEGRHLGLALAVIATAQLMVVLDATIVTVALPHMQTALNFSGSGLEWVLNAYVLALGGLLLLGGRLGDLLGRRRMFVLGLLLFSAASLAGGLATSPAWLLAARAVQGAGGAIVAPTALALIATTFPEGPPRNRAMGVYAAMGVAGGAVGLLAGGLLVTYASWRWVLFVNVPIGVVAALAALVVLPAASRSGAGRSGAVLSGAGRSGAVLSGAGRSGAALSGAGRSGAVLSGAVLSGGPGRRGRLDLPGTIAGTGGVAALVYGLSQADNGTSHWGHANVVAALAAAVVLLVAFAVIEARSRHALLPVRLLRNRDRVGANLVMLGVGAVIGGLFFFLVLFVEDLWGYSALRAGLAFLPFTAVMLVSTAVATKLVPRVGVRPLLAVGTVLVAGGLFWLSRLAPHGAYVSGLLWPALIIGTGLGLTFLPLSLVAMAGVGDADSGAASSLLNSGRQVGASIGLAVLGTVAWTVVANRAPAGSARVGSARAGLARVSSGGAGSVRAGSVRAGGAGSVRAGSVRAGSGGAASWHGAYQQALAAGFDRAFLVAAGIALLFLVVAVTTIRVRRADLNGHQS